ncbi:MAG TPA: sialidase family protein, partial [Tepidisphaeraceae bacterium]
MSQSIPARALLGCLLLVSAAALAADGPRPAELIESRKIWDAAPHSAFTGLIRHDGSWLCVFREGSAHIPGNDGKIRVIRSTDGQKWESAALIAEQGVDLRDPKICLASDGRLMIVMGGSFYAGHEPTPNRAYQSAHSRVSFSKDGVTWSAPQPVEGIGDAHWLWRVTWHKGTGYGAVYSAAKEERRTVLTLWKTADGVKYELLVNPAAPISASEATIRFLADDTMVVLVRGEGKDRDGWIGHSKPPYDKWDWHDGGRPAHGPDFLVLPDGQMF